MTTQQAREAIERELSTAEQAQNAGNDGMMRVCARRAVGIAIQHWLKLYPHPEWGADAMSRLRNLHNEETIPQDVREAARRLAEKVTENFTYSSTSNPIQDANRIISYLFT